MLVMLTAEDPAYPVRKLVGSKQPLRFHELSLAVNPLGLYGVQPRTLLRQEATHEPHSLTALLDSAVTENRAIV